MDSHSEGVSALDLPDLQTWEDAPAETFIQTKPCDKPLSVGTVSEPLVPRLLTWPRRKWEQELLHSGQEMWSVHHDRSGLGRKLGAGPQLP